MTPEQRIKELGLELPSTPKGLGNYAAWVRSGQLVMTSGQLPWLDGTLKYTGRVGEELDEAAGYQSARLSALNALAQLSEACGGDLRRVRKIVRLEGSILGTPGFTRHAAVLDGASDLFNAVFAELEPHSRAVHGVASMPNGATTLLYVYAEIDDAAVEELVPSLGIVRREISVRGQTISILEAGGGPRKILLLHGITSDATNWNETLPALAKAGFHAVAPDHLGFGLSSKPNLPISPQTLADMIGPMLDSLGWENALIVGQSMGGHVAGLFALQQPARVVCLVLVNAGYGLALPDVAEAADLGHAEVPGGLRALNPGTLDEARKLLSMVFYDKDRFVSSEAVDSFFAHRLSARDGWAIQSIIGSWARRERVLDDSLPKLGELPVLIVQSREDEVAPFALGEQLHAGIPNSRLAVLESCGHAPPIEAPESFNRILLEFLHQVSMRAPLL